jgi:hypothetical protein
VSQKARTARSSRKDTEQQRLRIQQIIFAALAIIIILSMIITAVSF